MYGVNLSSSLISLVIHELEIKNEEEMNGGNNNSNSDALLSDRRTIQENVAHTERRRYAEYAPCSVEEEV